MIRYYANISRCLGIYILFLLIGGASAVFNRNEAHINWKVAETENFRFYYEKPLEDVAEYVAGIAEHVYAHKIKRYNENLPGKVELVIRDDIFSNGLANPYQTTLHIWVSDWGIPLRSTHDWLKDVVAHEFSHIVSIQSGSKLSPSIVGLVIGYQDFYNEPVQTSVSTIIPFTSQPNWFAEGVAQYESELLGYDSWDSHRDMILRVAVLNDSLLSYDRMGVFAGKGLHWEQGPYTQGFGFVRYISQKYGDESLLKIWRENSRIHRQTLSGAMKRVLGKNGPEIWEDWKNGLLRSYKEQMDGLGQVVEGDKISQGGFFNYYPHWGSKGNEVYFVSDKGSSEFRMGLYKYLLADTVKKEEKVVPVSFSITGYYDMRDNDSTFVYASSKNKDKKGRTRLDIYEKNILQKASGFIFKKNLSEKRFTENQNAIQPNYNPQGSEVVYVKNLRTNFYLCICPVPAGPGPAADSERVIFPPAEMLKGRFGFNIYTPRFSPDGNQILFSYYDGQSRKIAVINRDGSMFKPLLNRPWDDRDPSWLPNGSGFIFSSDSTGIYNLYSYQIESGQIQSVTNVRGGAFLPALSPDGLNLAFVNYDKDGFSLNLLKNWQVVSNPGALVKKRPQPPLDTLDLPEFQSARSKYLGVPNRYLLQPLLIGQEMTSDNNDATSGRTKWMGGFSAFFNDPVNKNQLAMGGVFELGKGLDYFAQEAELLNPDKESEVFLSYWNHFFPVSTGMSFIRRNIVSFDTVRCQDCKIDGSGDSLEISNYSIPLKNVQVVAKYNLFETDITDNPMQASFLGLSMGYTWNDFYFFDMEGPFSFRFTYYKDIYLNSTLWFNGVAPTSKSAVAPQGMAAFINYGFHDADLIRQGSFQETFRVDKNGLIKGNFKEYQLQEFDAGLDYGLSVPWSIHSSIRLSGTLGSIVYWDLQNKSALPDSLHYLDSFFKRGLAVRGYPYLQDKEELLLKGENTVLISLDYNQVLWSDIFKQAWVVFVEDIYAHFFWEAGRAWDGQLQDAGLFEKFLWGEPASAGLNPWYQSLGWGIKVNSRIYHNFPFNLFFEASTGLNRVPDESGFTKKLEYLDLFGMNIMATRIHFGVAFGFYNGLMGEGALKALRKRSTSPYRGQY